MDIDPNAPLTLERACELVFAGEITPATLRAEARRGRLGIERIGRKHFVTLAGIEEMRRLCRITSPAPATFAPTESPSTADGISAKDALLRKLEKLRNDPKSR
jgi:hypothetical protein